MKANMLVLFMSLFCFRHCGDGSTVDPSEAASVIFTGAYEVDGCGYQIQLERDATIHKPSSLPEQYQKDGLKIWIEFRPDTIRYECGDLPGGRETIRILTIRPRNP